MFASHVGPNGPFGVGFVKVCSGIYDLPEWSAEGKAAAAKTSVV